MTKMRKNKGITLIALVITIIVLLILAGVTISALTGDSGILKNAEKAKDKTNLANAKEQVEIAVQGARLKEIKQDTISYETLNEELGNLTNKYTITPKEDAPLWTVTVGDYKTYVTEEGYIEEPVTNPYDADGWTYAWVYDNDKWSEITEKGELAEGKIVVKAYATEKEITPSNYEWDDGEEHQVISFQKGTEYHLVIEGQGNMGGAESEEDWTASTVEYILDGIIANEPIIIPYVTEAFICDGITNIGDWAFVFGISLNKISISNSVKTIGEGAFSDCINLMSIKIPNSVTSIGKYSFQECINLTNVSTGNAIENIEDGAFYGCTNLSNITMPNSLAKIGAGAFLQCANLKKISIPNNVTNIEYNAFWGCTKLTSISIENRVEHIGYAAFKLCAGLTSITYQGTRSEWNNISKDNNWNEGSSLTTIICTDGNITL